MLHKDYLALIFPSSLLATNKFQGPGLKEADRNCGTLMGLGVQFRGLEFRVWFMSIRVRKMIVAPETVCGISKVFFTTNIKVKA